MCKFHGLGMVISPPPLLPPTFGSWLFSLYRRFDNILPAAAAAAARRAVPERTLHRVIMRRIKSQPPQKHPVGVDNGGVRVSGPGCRSSFVSVLMQIGDKQTLCRSARLPLGITEPSRAEPGGCWSIMGQMTLRGHFISDSCGPPETEPVEGIEDGPQPSINTSLLLCYSLISHLLQLPSDT